MSLLGLDENVVALDEQVTCPVCGSALQLHRMEVVRHSEALLLVVGTYWWRLVCTGDWSHKVDRPV